MRVDLAAAGSLAAWCAPAAAPVAPFVSAAFRIPRRLASPSGIAITFDDGPHAEGTPAVLRELERAGARATFFLVGEQVERLPALAAEIAARGHEIGIHGFRHTLLLRRTPRAFAPTSSARRQSSRTRRASSRACTGRRTACSARRPCCSCAALAGGRSSGRVGAATGKRVRRRRRSPRGRHGIWPAATSCCCTTRITTARRAPGGGRYRRCRPSSRRRRQPVSRS